MEFPEFEDWASLGIDRIDFEAVQANATKNYQYSDLVVRESSAVVTAEGVYWVSGTVQNNGAQNARNIRVIGTFYNATGTVVAVGYTDPLSPALLGPSGTASFRVGAFDMNQTEVPSSVRISSYALLIQTEEPILSGTPPSPSPSTGPTNSTSPSDPADSNQSASPFETLNLLIIAVIVLGIVAFAVALRRRRDLVSAKNRKSSRKGQK